MPRPDLKKRFLSPIFQLTVGEIKRIYCDLYDHINNSIDCEIFNTPVDFDITTLTSVLKSSHTTASIYGRYQIIATAHHDQYGNTHTAIEDIEIQIEIAICEGEQEKTQYQHSIEPDDIQTIIEKVRKAYFG
ncbi:MAG: hypothetical protein HUK20_13210 [Fibrobacter sp.]|nr:hypothetical protein [Fibrobacter sp.]